MQSESGNFTRRIGEGTRYDVGYMSVMSTKRKAKNAAFMRIPGDSLGVQVSLPLLSDAPEMLINTAFPGFFFCLNSRLSTILSTNVTD